MKYFALGFYFFYYGFTAACDFVLSFLGLIPSIFFETRTNVIITGQVSLAHKIQIEKLYFVFILISTQQVIFSNVNIASPCYSFHYNRPQENGTV